MPRRKYADENEGFFNAFNQRNLLLEPVTLHIMKEMGVMPLNPTEYIEECSSQEDIPSPVKPLQVVNGTKRRMLVIPETSTNFKAYRENFVLCQKFPHQYSTPGEDHFSRLSDEIILQIFKWLPKTTLVKCAEVCKRWKTLSYDESLWTRFDLGKKHVGSGVLGILLQRGIVAFRLAMSEIRSPVFKDSIFAHRQSFCKLQYLDLSMASIAPEDLADILAVCNKLKKLSLEACEVNEDCCKFIAQNKTLEVLNMTMTSGLTPVGLREIAVKCSKLKEWNLAWTLLNECCMKTFLPVLPGNLTRLNISGHRQTLDDEDLLFVATRCPNLVELDISDCHLLTESSFIQLVKTCSKLEHLHTSRCYKIPTHCYRYLKHHKNIKYLEIFRTLTDDALAYLREYMPAIKINTNIFSTIARPTTGSRRTAIWGLKVRDRVPDLEY